LYSVQDKTRTFNVANAHESYDNRSMTLKRGYVFYHKFLRNDGTDWADFFNPRQYGYKSTHGSEVLLPVLAVQALRDDAGFRKTRKKSTRKKILLGFKVLQSLSPQCSIFSYFLLFFLVFLKPPKA
jgi:hypothetical protein